MDASAGRCARAAAAPPRRRRRRSRRRGRPSGTPRRAPRRRGPPSACRRRGTRARRCAGRRGRPRSRRCPGSAPPSPARRGRRRRRSSRTTGRSRRRPANRRARAPGDHGCRAGLDRLRSGHRSTPVDVGAKPTDVLTPVSTRDRSGSDVAIADEGTRRPLTAGTVRGRSELQRARAGRRARTRRPAVGSRRGSTTSCPVTSAVRYGEASRCRRPRSRPARRRSSAPSISRR